MARLACGGWHERGGDAGRGPWTELRSRFTRSAADRARQCALGHPGLDRVGPAAAREASRGREVEARQRLPSGRAAPRRHRPLTAPRRVLRTAGTFFEPPRAAVPPAAPSPARPAPSCSPSRTLARPASRSQAHTHAAARSAPPLTDTWAPPPDPAVGRGGGAAAARIWPGRLRRRAPAEGGRGGELGLGEERWIEEILPLDVKITVAIFLLTWTI